MYGRTVIVGRLSNEPELKQTPSGVYVCTFSVAVDRPYKKKGEDKQADFYNVVAWRNTGEFVSRFFSKSNPILVEGHMECRSYTDKSGQKRYAWELIADNVRFVGGQNEGRAEVRNAQQEQASTGGDGFTEIDGDGGDLPF